MITLPPGFDVAALMDEYFMIAVPFISVAAMFAFYIVITKVFKKAF